MSGSAGGAKGRVALSSLATLYYIDNNIAEGMD